jgi:hypothetical protein
MEMTKGPAAVSFVTMDVVGCGGINAEKPVTPDVTLNQFVTPHTQLCWCARLDFCRSHPTERLSAENSRLLKIRRRIRMMPNAKRSHAGLVMPDAAGEELPALAAANS